MIDAASAKALLFIFSCLCVASPSSFGQPLRSRRRVAETHPPVHNVERCLIFFVRGVRGGGKGAVWVVGVGRADRSQLTAQTHQRQDKSTMTTRMTPQQLAPLSLSLFSSFSCCFLFLFFSRSFFFFRRGKERTVPPDSRRTGLGG